MNPQPDPNAVYAFLGVVGFLLALANGGLALFRNLGKQRREVTFPEEYVSKPEFNDLKAVVRQHEEYGKERREKIYSMINESQKHTDQKIEALRGELKDGVDGVHERVSALVGTVGEMRGEIRQALKERD